MITKADKLAAQIMLKQLDHEALEALEVVLLEAPDPRHSSHHIRAVENKNPFWYQELCKQYPKNRTHPRQRKEKFTDSLIDRGSVKRALSSIAAGKDRTTYTRRFLPFVKKYTKTFGATK